MTPEENVRSVIASARLEGIEVDDEFQGWLLQVARGELDADVLVAQLVRAADS